MGTTRRHSRGTFSEWLVLSPPSQQQQVIATPRRSLHRRRCRRRRLALTIRLRGPVAVSSPLKRQHGAPFVHGSVCDAVMGRSYRGSLFCAWTHVIGKTNDCYVSTEHAITYDVKMKDPELALRSLTRSPYGKDYALIHGVVKFFNDEKGCGFITQDDGGYDLFVHRTAVNGEALMACDEVTESPYTTNVGFHSCMIRNDEPCNVRALTT